MKTISLFFVSFLVLISYVSPLMAAHGVSIDGQLKYAPGFERFDYASEHAVKGGHLVMHGLGSFDKMNPMTLKGLAPDGLNELVFETLAVAGLDEAFAEYGLIARDIALAPDGLSVTFTINEKARFSDNTPVTPHDVKFSLETLKSDAAHPFYQAYFHDITGAEVVDEHRVRFLFATKNRELHMVACQLPVLSQKFYSAHPFDTPSMAPPIGSGPYIVGSVNTGKSINYRRNPDYWARDLNVRRGMFNFDSITFKYFKDQVISVEAFKAHEFDFMYINIAKQWARDLTGARFDNKKIVKEALVHRNNAGMQGFAFNVRRPFFSDRRVRKAVAMAFDFEWANKALFFDQYTRCNSFFSNSELAARTTPDAEELKLLTPFRDQLPKEVFTEPMVPFSTKPPDSVRGNLKKAKKILAEAGWTVRDGRLVNSDGTPFEFEILLGSSSFERVMASFAKNLEKLGIKVDYRSIDSALYTRRLDNFDFDMTVQVFGQSQSPGNEQRDYWHSSSADRIGSRNIIGIKDPVVDQLVDKIIYANTRQELVVACRALDRVLWYGYYVVPNWYLARHRVAYWNIFERPRTLPLYYNYFQAVMTWWMKGVTNDE